MKRGVDTPVWGLTVSDAALLLGLLGVLAAAALPPPALAQPRTTAPAAEAASPAGTAPAAEPARHPRWGIGWDGLSDGPLLRYRWRDVWQFGLAAGPNDAKDRKDSREWDSDAPGDTALDGRQESRRESGWVRAAAGRRIWREGRFALSVDAAVRYQWEHRQTVYRWPSFHDGVPDARNVSSTADAEEWQVALGLRPSCEVGRRFSVEWECGLLYSRTQERSTEIEWHDVDPAHRRSEDDDDGHGFNSYGWLYQTELKLIFWF